MGVEYIGVILAVISLIIGLVIVNDIVIDTQNYSQIINESHTLTAVPQNVTLNNNPIPTSTGVTIVNGSGAVTLAATNYSIISRTDSIIEILNTYDNDSHGQVVQFTYEYEPTEYLDSSISRTIVGYFVPIAMLGALLIIAGIYIRKE